MKKNILVILLLISIFQSSWGQDKDAGKIINYRDTLIAGLNLVEEEKYQEALDIYFRIPESDTLYAITVPEIMLAYYRLEKYKEGVEFAIQASRKHLFYDPTFYINWGSCYDRLEQYDKAIALYQQAIKTFPLSYLLYYNLGYSYSMNKEFEKALESYQMVLKINPIYAKIHYQIGILAMAEGQTSLAALAFSNYLYISPNGTSSNYVLSLLNEVLTGDYKKEQTSNKLKLLQGEDFSEIDLLLENYVGLDKKYKVKTKLQHPIIKQTHLLYQELAKLPENQGFWYQMYVPVVRDIMENKKFELFSYYMMQSSGNENHQKIINSKNSDINSFVDWLRVSLDENHRKHLLPFPKANTKDIAVYRANSGFAISSICGIDEAGKNVGYCEDYHENGNLKAEMNYNATSNLEGKKVSYHPNGKMAVVEFYANGIPQDSVLIYTKYGRPEAFYTVKDNAINGVVRYYHPTGSLSVNMTVKNDKLEGLRSEYFENEKLSSSVNFTASKREGLYEAFYNTGKIYEKVNLINNMKEGPDSIFYENGQLKTLQYFVQDEKDGPFTEFYENGVKSQEGQYKNGKMIGQVTHYNWAGSMDTQAIFDEEGKRTGKYTEFYQSGEPYFQLDYQKGEIIGYRYFDKSGKVIQEDKRKFGTFQFIGYHYNGVKSIEGEYGTHFHQGIWKYYDAFGMLTSEQPYKDGELDGLVVSYFPNGKIKSTEYYSNGERSGKYEKFNEAGQKIEEGYYENDKRIGSQIEYFENGNLSETTYYLNGEIHGFWHQFALDGKIYKTNLFEEGVITAQFYFQPDGTLIDSFFYTNGCGRVSPRYANSNQIKEDYTLVNNSIHGLYTTYYVNGAIETQGNYYSGKKHGVWKDFYLSGKVQNEGRYNQGLKDGDWTEYHKNGQKYRVYSYANGNLHGDYKVFNEEGKITYEGTYFQDSKQGNFKLYNNAGEYDHTRTYESDVLVAISYEGPQGIVQIPVNSGNLDVSIYFKNGKLARKYTLKNGWNEGEYLKYHSNGQLIESNQYLNDELQGLCFDYYQNGVIKAEKNFHYGKIHGKQTTYHPNGKINESYEGQYGLINGIYQQFNEKGVLEHEYVYDMGEIIKINK